MGGFFYKGGNAQGKDSEEQSGGAHTRTGKKDRVAQSTASKELGEDGAHQENKVDGAARMNAHAYYPCKCGKPFLFAHVASVCSAASAD